ncbi:AGAP008369-PA-like protein [Anopheles sinensis]|uniref:AGAP008369-PA-like protein n=1 Tax=Anopheles sinensis TaxID=74873 RepID=A0A084W5X3_ANOSI|nr:AGAP008369-PA-like protein [Anopheles sinensis]
MGWAQGSVPKSVFVGTGKEEYVYQYVLDVTTGVVEPEYGSMYRVKADLHVSPDPNGNGTFVHFVDPKVFLYTGPLPLPMEPTAENYTEYAQQAEAIVQPFYITYDKFGMVQEVFTTKSDVLWSVNLKKGVAAMLQLPMDKIPTKKFVKPIVFTEAEETVYGKVNVTYAVHSVNEMVQVIKTPDYQTFTQLPYGIYSNVEPEHVYHNWSAWNSVLPVVEYELSFSKDGVHAYKVHSESTKYVQPFTVEGQKQFVTSKQSLVFTHTTFTVPATKKFEFNNFPMYHYVHYETAESVFEETYPTISTITPTIDATTVIPKVQVMLYEAVQYLQENPITHQEIDTKHGLVISRIIEILKPFTVENYGQFWTVLTKSTTPKDLMAVDIFCKVLPSVGTKYSVQFVMDVVKNHKVKDSVAAGMLFSLGVNVRAPSIELLHSVEDFVNFASYVKPEVAHAAILSFGTMIYKTFQHDQHSVEIEKYIKVYYKKLKEAKTFEDQLVWLHGIKNIQLGTVGELLVPLVKGEQVLDMQYDRHLQVHVIYALMEIMEHEHDALFEILFPIVIDETIPVELRVAAVKVIISMEDVQYCSKVVAIMKGEKDPHLYSFFVTTMRSLVNSDVYFGTDFYHYLERVVEQFVHYDPAVETKSFFYDYVDAGQQVGSIIRGNMIADVKHNKVNQFYVSFSPYVMDRVYDLYSVYVKFEGVHNPLSLLWPKLFNVDPKTVNEPITKNYENVPVHVEFTFMANGKVVYTKYFNEETIKQFYTHTYLTIFKTLQYQFTHVLNVADVELYTPTFDGVPTKIDLKLPLLTQFKYNVVVPSTTNQNEVTLTVNSFFRMWAHGYYGVSVYNPFALTWQGTRRVQSFDFNVPLVFDVIFNFQQNSFKFVWTKHSNEVFNVVGFKSHVKTQVYARPETEVDYLKVTCPVCHQYDTTTAHPVPKKKDVVLYESHSKYTGIHFYLSAFDVEVPPTVKYYKSITDVLTSELFHELERVTVFDFVAKYFTWFYTTVLPPQPTTFGVMGYVNPCKMYPFDKVEFSFKVDSDVLPHKLWTTPDHRQYVKMTAIFKKTDVVVNHWDVNVYYTHEHGTYFKTVNVQVTHQTPGEKNMNICIDWVKNVVPESVTGKLMYFHGYSYDHKCVKDDMVVSMEWTGVQSEVQKNITHHPYTPSYHTVPTYYYQQCVPRVLPMFGDYSVPVTYECADVYTTVRKYHYTVDYQHVHPVYIEFVKPFWFWVKHVVPSYYPDIEQFHYVPENRFVVDVEYPMYYSYPIVDVVVKSAYETVAFDHVPYYDWVWMFQPESTVFTKYFEVMKSYGYVDNCVVNPVYEYAPYHYGVAKTPVYNEWILYASDHPVTYTWAVYVQKLEKNFVAFKLVLNGHSIVVQPVFGKHVENTATKYTFTVDSELMHALEYGSVETYPFKYFYIYDTVVFVVPNVSLYVVYDGHQVKIETAKTENVTYYGQCYEK